MFQTGYELHVKMKKTDLSNLTILQVAHLQSPKKMGQKPVKKDE